VINYDLPKTRDEYVHRIGRTGRVGNAGRATSFYDAEKDSSLAPELVKVLSEVCSSSETLTDVSGGAARPGLPSASCRFQRWSGLRVWWRRVVKIAAEFLSVRWLNPLICYFIAYPSLNKK